ncbi:MAG: hypothetical protein SGI73_21285 [Chloroflexota bacterium]|nr:hypothetical protein [Chloroflexota bacterium]
MTTMKHAAYSLFTLTVAAFVLHALMALVVGAQFLAANSLLASILPYPNGAGMVAAWWRGALISGILGGGLILAADAAPQAVDSRRWRRGFLIWRALVVAVPLCWLLDIPLIAGLEATMGGVVLAAGAALWRVWGAASASFEGTLRLVWTAGAACIGSGLILHACAPLLTSSFARQTALSALADALSGQIGLSLTAVALAFWQLHRISNLTPAWAARGAAVCAGVLVVAGAWLALPALYPLGAADGVRMLGGLGVGIAPIAAIMVAAHAHRALVDRNASATLAGYWIALGVVLWLLGVGVVGAFGTLPALAVWTAGTPLAALSASWSSAGAAAIILGMINQAMAEARGQNRRITGLLPFWLIAAGWLGSGAAMGMAGVVQVMTERALGVAYLDAQRLIAPLGCLGLIGGLMTVLGIGVYALGFVVRRVVLPNAVGKG